MRRVGAWPQQTARSYRLQHKQPAAVYFEGATLLGTRRKQLCHYLRYIFLRNKNKEVYNQRD